MTDRRELGSERAALGLTLAALGCTPQPKSGLDDEIDGGTDELTDDGDGDVATDDEVGEPVPNDIPFELELVVFNQTGKFVALRFSEPVAPVDGVDPRDFRISLAAPGVVCVGYPEYDCYDHTMYWDANFFAEVYTAYYYYYPFNRLETDLIVSGNMPTDIVLRFETPLDPVLCDIINAYPPGYLSLFAHYSPGEIPVQSADGEVLSPIGPEWVEIAPQYSWETYGMLPNLNPQLPIPCNL
jgi:hypothetical protein